MILTLAAALWLIGLGVSLALRRRSDVWRDVILLGVLGAATAGFFWRLLFTPNFWMPAGGGDLAQFLYPIYTFAAEWWRRGVLPLWNPHLFAGAPFVGDSQSGIFYPINLLAFFVSRPLAFRDMELLSVLHFAIAGVTMYAFLRWGRWGAWETGPRRDLARVAALAGAVAFEFSDLFVTHFGNLNLIAVAAWMPLVLLLYRRAIVDRSAGLAAASGLVLALAFSAGHPQSFLFIVVALVLFGVWHVLTIKALARPLIYLILIAVVALGLSAPSLLPIAEMAQRTVRTTYSYEQAALYSLPPAQLIGLLIPGFFGRGPQNAWGPWPRVEVGYIGILPLILALLALVLRRDRPTRWFGGFALVGMAFALGGYAILHGWLYQWAPGFGQLRAPARSILLFDFGVSALAAIGLDALLHALPRHGEIALRGFVRTAPWAFLLIALAAGAVGYTILILGQGQDAVLFARMANAVNGLAFFLLLLGLASALVIARATRSVQPRVWTVLAVALIFFDLFSLGTYVDVSTDDPTRVFDHPNVVDWIQSQDGLARVDARETGVDRIWPADTSILYGLYDVNGDNPLVLADFDRYWQSLGSRSSSLYDLLNIRFLIGRKNVPLDRAKFQLAYDGDPALDVFENTRVLPRAFIATQALRVADSPSALAAIRAPGFDPSKTVVIEEGAPAGGNPHAQPVSAVEGQNAAKITGYGPNEIVVETESSTGGILVLSEVYYPGWRGWIGNQEMRETVVLRADYLFRAVEVPAGKQHVRLEYDPMSFKLGVGLFVITAFGLVGWSLWKLSIAHKPGLAAH